MGLVAGARVADVGTGTGYFVPYLSTAVGAGGEVLAIDIEPSMVRYVKARAAKARLTNVSVRLALADDPLLAPHRLDRILVVNTWHHIAHRVDYAKKLLQALKPGGTVWLLDFKHDAPHGPPVAHRLPPQQVASELTAAGFTVRLDEHLLPHQYIVVGSPAAAPH